MRRLLIVDDEQRITDSLYYFFKEQEQLDLDIYRAYTAHDALGLLERAQVDVVISDIRMPEMDGLQLLDAIKRHWPASRVIFLTGHSKFEYAYKALQYDGVSYVLKNEGFDVVLSAVERELAAIDELQTKETMIDDLERRMENVQPVIQREFVSRLIHGETIEIGIGELDEVQARMDSELPVLVTLARFDDLTPGMSVRDLNRMAEILDIAMERLLAGRPHRALRGAWNQGAVWLLQASPEDSSFGRYVSQLLESVRDRCLAAAGFSVSLAVCECAVPWSHVRVVYEHLRYLFAVSVGLNRGAILQEHEMPPSSTAPHRPPVSDHDVARLVARFYSGDRNGFLHLLRDLAEPIRSEADLMDPSARRDFYRLALGVLDLQYAYQGGHPPVGDPTDLQLLSPETHGSWPAALDHLVRITEHLFVAREQLRSRASNWVIERLRSYIHAHVSDDLSLTALADHVGLNPSYISRLYKEVTGENLQHHIASIRLEQARELLETGNQRVSEIAREVGFGSSKYFITVFKNAHGLTPQEWRAASSSRTVDT